MRTYTAAFPVLTAESGLIHYLEEIRRFPMLEPQEEYMLAKRRREHGDREAAHRLLTSHLRLGAKIAMGDRADGFPHSEVNREGNVGDIGGGGGWAGKRRQEPGDAGGGERGGRHPPQGTGRGPERAQRTRAAHLRGAPARRRADHARGAGGRVRGLARARAPDRGAR